ncbi:hypothetical protein [Amycolatopsis sp. GM8]|uniref:hypothetical protein n=1 Tax=Amycolatopsis sp. GM8 TaxID=2896530 RepID=UPI001F29FE17|nr:hypothetical protein [Amycolatopsis sp. GM8]
MGDPFSGAVSWDRRGDDRIGVCRPVYVGLLRVHVSGLRKLAVRRIAEHEQASGPLGPLDRRLDSVLWMRRLGENIPAASELDVLVPTANRFQAVLDLLPESGGVFYLRGWQDRYLLGTVALDVKVAIEAWLRAWSLGELVDGVPCPDEIALRAWRRQCEWLRDEIVDPLQPEPEAA